MTDASTNRTFFEGDLSAPDPIPEQGIEAATRLMRDGRLFRYGEDRGSLPEAAMLEEEFAAYMGMKYCIGLNSGGCALYVALMSAGLEAGDKVLLNAFTLAPVPGAIDHAGGVAVLVDIDDRFVIDIDDLDRKAGQTGAKFLMLSYMRGHIPDMDKLMAICRKHDLIVIEDCAHTMGAGWDGRLTGTYGVAGCFSTQTFKHVNSGEGGLLVTDDEDIAARAILRSGSYMLYAQHRARPDMAVFDKYRASTPNCSMRMSGLVASILRPQLTELDDRNRKWRHMYDVLAPMIDAVEHLSMPIRPEKDGFVPSSLQFMISGIDDARTTDFLSDADANGVHIKWFGAETPVGFTSRHDHWSYLDQTDSVPNADEVLHGLCDIRLPLWLSDDDCRILADVLVQAMAASGKAA